MMRTKLWSLVVQLLFCCKFIAGVKLIETQQEGIVATSQEGIVATTSPPKRLPIVLLHGINSKPSDLDILGNLLQKLRPGSIVWPLHSYDGAPFSWLALKYQLRGLKNGIKRLKRKNPLDFQNGYHLVCHSQGALLCRAFCQTVPDHNVHTLVSLAGPQAGVFGDAWLRFLPSIAQTTTIDEAYLLAYESWIQDTVSAANMWNDPYHQKEYLAGNKFLPWINGQLEHQSEVERSIFRRNLLKLQKAAFLVGDLSDDPHSKRKEFDGGIEPWQSGVFGSFVPQPGGEGEGGNQFLQLEDQEFYKKDSFGLKSLDNAGKLVLLTPEGVQHDDWIYNVTIINKYIVPLLV